MNTQVDGFKPIEPGILDQVHNYPEQPHQPQSTQPLSSSEHIEYINGQRFDTFQYFNEDRDTYEVPIQQEYNILDDVTRYKNHDPQVPSVTVPIAAGNYESYIGFLVTTLYEIPEFRFKILSYQFKDLGFDEEWFRGVRVPVDPEVFTIEKNGVVHNMRFLLELQRLFIFLDNDKSSRFFASVKQFIMNIPGKFFAEPEDLSEMISNILEWLTTKLKAVEIDIEELFTSTIKDTSSHGSITRHAVPVDMEHLKHDIYQTFYGLLWDTKHNKPLGNYDTLGDVLTFAIQPDDGTNRSNVTGIRLSERFYPGVFTEAYNTVFTKLTHEGHKLKNSIARNEKRLMDFEFYENFNVTKLLKTTKNFFQGEGLGDIVDEIKSIQESIKLSEHSSQEKIRRYGDQLMDVCPTDIENILETARGLQLPEVESYLLTTVIMSDLSYVFLKRDKVTNTNKWYHVEFVRPRNMVVNNFQVTEVTFSEIRTAVRKLTNVDRLDNPLVIVYTKETSFMQKVTGENYYPEILEFIELDQANLENQTTSEIPDYESSEDLIDEPDLIDLDEESTDESEALESNNEILSNVASEGSTESKGLDIEDDDLEVCQDENDDDLNRKHH